jgi:dTDP-4-amino-4,6-dideoxygalactose transaminase
MLSGSTSAAEDARMPVDLPAMMRQHMLANMRDHLKALNEIQAALAARQFDHAADIAEQRLGMTSMVAHGSAHMAPFMPQKMREIGSAMHHAASRFALVATEPASGDHVARSLAALVPVSERCVACHAAFRLK